MAVKVSKLWSNKKFTTLTKDSKILYLYLCTSPSISFAGVLHLNLQVVEIETAITLEDIRISTKELIDKGYVYVGKHEDEIYFVVIDHFKTAPKSESTVIKLTKELASLPQSLQSKLQELGISTDKKMSEFIKPTIQAVTEYSISKGYKVNAETFINYYDETSLKFGRNDIWFDGRGKQVKDWKGKLRKVWFKDEFKLEPVKGAPKGFEFFFIEENGDMKFPDGWRDGKPFSKNFVLNKELQREYEKRKGNS